MTQTFAQATPQSVLVDNAIVIPPPMRGRFGRLLPAGVVTARGTIVPEAAMATERRSNRRFRPDTAVLSQARRRLRGSWLFGGVLSYHFGHQITRSLGRLHGLAQAQEIAGVLFLPLDSRTLAGGEVEMFCRTAAALGITARFHLQRRPARVDRLIVPPDLFGESNGCFADPVYVEWVRSQVNQLPSSLTGTDRLYVTRTGLNPRSGRVLCEEVLEENFRYAGFEILRPETISPQEQVAAYRAAKVIVMTDGSAGHLAALCRQSGQKIVMIARRHDRPAYLINHIESFGHGLADSRLHYIDVLVGGWKRATRKTNVSMGELDFIRLRDALVATGVIGERSRWQVPTGSAIEASKRRGLLAHETLVHIARPV